MSNNSALVYLCWWCKHFDVKAYDTVPKVRCKAFPERIPLDIYLMNISHLIKYPNDQDIQFERQTDVDQFPEVLKAILEQGNLHRETLFQITMIWLKEQRYPSGNEIVAIEMRHRENAANSKSENEQEN